MYSTTFTKLKNDQCLLEYFVSLPDITQQTMMISSSVSLLDTCFSDVRRLFHLGTNVAFHSTNYAHCVEWSVKSGGRTEAGGAGAKRDASEAGISETENRDCNQVVRELKCLL
jgi:hypothetical protein